MTDSPYKSALPWTIPFCEWSDEELDQGLEACDEYGWDGLRRSIDGEQEIRLNDEGALDA